MTAAERELLRKLAETASPELQAEANELIEAFEDRDVMRVDVRELTPELESIIRQLRSWHAEGHTEGCSCKPCAALRDELIAAGVLDLLYSYEVAR